MGYELAVFYIMCGYMVCVIHILIHFHYLIYVLELVQWNVHLRYLCMCLFFANLLATYFIKLGFLHTLGRSWVPLRSKHHGTGRVKCSFTGRQVCVLNGRYLLHYILWYPGVPLGGLTLPEANHFSALATYHHSGMNKRLT